MSRILLLLGAFALIPVDFTGTPEKASTVRAPPRQTSDAQRNDPLPRTGSMSEEGQFWAAYDEGFLACQDCRLHLDGAGTYDMSWQSGGCVDFPVWDETSGHYEREGDVLRLFLDTGVSPVVFVVGPGPSLRRQGNTSGWQLVESCP